RLHCRTRWRRLIPTGLWRPIPLALPTLTVPIPARRRLAPPWLRFCVERAAPLPLLENLAAIHPSLDADHAVSRMRLSEAVIDVGPQGVERKLSLQVPF